MINTAKPIPGDESEPKATLVPDPRNDRSEAAFDTLVAALEASTDRWSDDQSAKIVDAVKVARRLLVPQSGPRPITSSLDGYPDPATRFDVESIQMLTDVFTTALEGGIGYWSVCEEYSWDTVPAERYATIRDDEGTRHRVDLYTVQEGLIEARRLIRLAQDAVDRNLPTAVSVPKPGSEFFDVCERASILLSGRPCSEEALVQFYEAESMFDATAADIVVQLGLFGSVVYG